MIIIPIYILIILIFARIKKVACFDTFIDGAKNGILSAYNLFPTIFGLVLAINIFTNSGIVDVIKNIVNHKTIVPELFNYYLFWFHLD